MSRPEQTQHGFKSKFGLNTPHKYPDKNQDKKVLLDLSSDLYPTGRAWDLSDGSDLNLLHQAFNLSFERLKADSDSLINFLLPDNNEFSVEDARYWENKYGLISNENLSLSLRKEILLRKISFPGRFKTRQNILYINEQLEVYGFDVKAYENKFFDVNGNIYYKSASDVFLSSLAQVQHGDETQHGEGTQHGSGNFDLIANSYFDENYSIGGDENLWATFFIASKSSLEEQGYISSSRKREFRELILKLKPAHLVAFTFINYI